MNASNYAGLLLVGLIALCAGVLHILVPLNHDAAWILESAGRLLDGGRFGREVVDANPPLAWWISCIPVAFARLSGTGLALSFVLFTLICGLLSVWLTNTVLADGLLDRSGRLVLIPVLTVLLLVAPGYDFGQREHLMLIGSVPYLAAASLTADGHRLRPRLAIAIGLFAAPAFCLKPYFLLVPIFTEAWLAMRRRSPTVWMRPEFLVTPVFGLLYVTAIKLFAPDYLAGAMPEASAIYWVFNAPAPAVLFAIVKSMAPALIGWLLILIAEHRKPSPLAQAAGIGALGAATGAFLQLKGFNYHLLPAVGIAAFACTADCVSRGQPRKVIRIVVLGFILVTAAVAPIRQMRDGTTERVAALSSIFQKYAGNGGTVYAFITSPRDIHPAVVASNTIWASDACCIYYLPAAIRSDERPVADRPRLRSIAASQTNHIIADLVRSRPAVIVIDANAEKLGFDRPFDYLPYLLANPSFATLWRSYAERDSVSGFRVFVRTSHS